MKAEQVSYFMPLALVAICTAFSALPSWQALCSWAEFGFRCCRVSVPGCCRVQLQQKSPHCENKAKSPWAAGKGGKTKRTATTKKWEKVIFFSLETMSKQFCHAVQVMLLPSCIRQHSLQHCWYNAEGNRRKWISDMPITHQRLAASNMLSAVISTGQNACMALALVQLLKFCWTTLSLYCQCWSCQEKVDPASSYLLLLSVGSGFGGNSLPAESRTKYSRGSIWLGGL